MVGSGTNCQPRIKASWKSGIGFSISRRGNSVEMKLNLAAWRLPANSKVRTAHRALQFGRR
jgi:hypothetical protein